MESNQEIQILSCQLIFANVIWPFPILKDKRITWVGGQIADDGFWYLRHTHLQLWPFHGSNRWWWNLICATAVHMKPLQIPVDLHIQETVPVYWGTKGQTKVLYFTWCSRNNLEKLEKIFYHPVICTRTFSPTFFRGWEEIRIMQFLWLLFIFEVR